MGSFQHKPVMAAEVIRYLAPRCGSVYLDGTLGGGGHSRLILDASSPDGIVIGIDRDPAAIAAAKAQLAGYGERFIAVKDSFDNLDAVAQRLGFTALDGLLLDLGVSSHQLDSAARGFSFRLEGPLDMRMDPEAETDAAWLVNNASAKELEQIIREFGEERFAGKIARQIVSDRLTKPFETTLELAGLVYRAIPRRFHEERIHPATRTFQALRMAVNDELEQVRKGVLAGLNMLASGGRMVVITFHSLEDRMVKKLFKDAASGCNCPPRFPVCVCNKTPLGRLLVSRPVVAGADELAANPRARSAKLRVFEKF
ncbi:MAG: 16S rRNA (cytosine(1402)-N(4))-methyltransferase RsmH [Trichlorobacter sp.]|nr:16S rRNA (cytosine(1402)-N(4))-methyltransferase RsmH [Trichlorobacter sp.]